MVITSTSAAIFIAKLIVGIHIKNTWVDRILPFLFPKEKYKNELENSLVRAIDKYKSTNSLKPEFGKIFFFEHKESFEKLSRFLFFSSDSNRLEDLDFSKFDTVIKPSTDEINDFYDFLGRELAANSKLKDVFLEEKYKEQVFLNSKKLDSILDGIGNLDSKIESGFSRVENNQKYIQETINTLSKRNKLDLTLNEELDFYLEGTYFRGKRISERKAIVDSLYGIAQSKLLFLKGGVGVGKSQLAGLITERFQGGTIWVSLKDSQSKNYFSRAIVTISRIIGKNLTRDLNDLIVSIETGAVIVFDSFPDIKNPDHLSSFSIFIDQLLSKGVGIIITSNYGSLNSINEVIEKEASFYEIPFLVKSEVEEVLFHYGIDKSQLDKFSNLVMLVTEGHPMIVKALTNFLHRSNWEYDERSLIRIFKGDYKGELNKNIYSLLGETIKDDKTRELIYRLKSVRGVFNKEEIQTVADVEPKILFPGEKFADIIDDWTEKYENGYELSPLIKNLDQIDIERSIQLNVCYNLGRQILKQKNISQIQARKAILYFDESEHYNEAAFVLLVVLNSLKDNPEIFFEWGFDQFWYYSTFPNEMDLFHQLHLRMLQIITLNKSNSFLIEDLERLMKLAIKDGVPVGPIALLLASHYSIENPKKCNEYFSLGIKNYNQNIGEIDLEKEFGEEAMPENMLWISAAGVKNKEEVSNWFKAFEELDLKQKERCKKLETAHLGSLMIGQNIINEENLKEPANRDWLKVFTEIDGIRKKASYLGLNLLEANSIKYCVRVKSQWLSGTDDLVEYVKSCDTNFYEDELTKFIVLDSLGRELFYRKRFEEAFEYLDQVHHIELPEIYTEKIDTYLVMSNLLIDKDSNESLKFINLAVKEASHNQFTNDVLKAKMIAEKSLVLFNREAYEDSIIELELAAGILINSYDSSDEYKISLIRVGHIAGYLIAMLEDGIPPEKDIKGDPYDKPKPGMLTKTYSSNDLNEFYYEEQRFILAQVFFSHYSKKSNYEGIIKWGEKTQELAKDIETNIFEDTLILQIPYFVLGGQYDKSISIVHRILSGEGKNLRKEKLDNSSNPYLKKRLDLESASFVSNFDELVVDLIFLPSVMEGLLEDLEKGEKHLLKSLLSCLKRSEHLFECEKVFFHLEYLIEQTVDDGIQGMDLYNWVASQEEMYKTTKVIGYLLAANKSNTKDAFNLHLHTIGSIDNTYLRLSPAIHNLVVRRYFESVWFEKIKNQDKYFSSYFFWESKSLPLYESTVEKDKIKRLFQILCHHANYDLPDQVEEWIDSIGD